MIVGQRIKERLEVLNMNQSQLARLVGINQSTIAALIAGRTRSSTHLHKIARHLRTTVAYLTGETDDPDEGAPPPEPEPTIQFVQMPVAFPTQPALEAMFRGLIRSMPDLSGDALAHELSMLLPTGLELLRQPYRYEPMEHDDAEPELEEEPPVARRANARGSRR